MLSCRHLEGRLVDPVGSAGREVLIGAEVVVTQGHLLVEAAGGLQTEALAPELYTPVVLDLGAEGVLVG